MADIVTVLLACATVIMGITIPQIWGMSRDIGSLEAGQAELKESVNKLHVDVRQGFATVNTTMSTLIARVNENVLDPADLLAKAGVPVSKDYRIYVMGDDSFIVLATTMEAVEKMHSAGYSPKQITPYLQGFVIENVMVRKEPPKQ
jgi:hypothetical protein